MQPLSKISGYASGMGRGPLDWGDTIGYCTNPSDAAVVISSRCCC